jgi:hypothetical protein
MASAGPVLVPGRSKWARTSAARFLSVCPSDDLAERLGDAAADGLDELRHQRTALDPIGFLVSGDHSLIDAPSRFHLNVGGVGEQGGEAVGPGLGQQIRAGVQGPEGPVERVVPPAAVAAQVLLDAAPPAVQGVPGETDNVVGSITATAAGSSATVAVVKPVTPSIATTSTPSRRTWGRAVGRVEVFGWLAQEPPSSEDLDLHPGPTRPPRLLPQLRRAPNFVIADAPVRFRLVRASRDRSAIHPTIAAKEPLRAAQHRAHGRRQQGCEPVPDTSTTPRIGHGVQRLHEAPLVTISDLHGTGVEWRQVVDEVAQHRRHGWR